MTTLADRRNVQREAMQRRIAEAAERLAEVLQDPPGSDEGYRRDAAYILGIEGDGPDDDEAAAE